jgi:nicotinamide mononucleotide adenylyltransferase
VRCLLKDAGIKLDETALLERSTYSAKHIRDLIRWGSSDWEALVPKGVVEIIKKYKMDERIRQIGETRLKR